MTRAKEILVATTPHVAGDEDIGAIRDIVGEVHDHPGYQVVVAVPTTNVTASLERLVLNKRINTNRHEQR